MIELNSPAQILAPRTPEKVHHEIASMLAKGATYIDALVKKSSILKQKVKAEAVNLRLVQSDDQDITKLCE
jgi:hypothetical protein